MTSEESRGPGEPHVWAVLDTVPGLLSPLRPSFKCSTAFPLQLSSVRAEGVRLLSKLWNPTRLGGEAWEASKPCVNNWKVGGFWKVGGLWTIGKCEAWHCMRERLTIYGQDVTACGDLLLQEMWIVCQFQTRVCGKMAIGQGSGEIVQIQPYLLTGQTKKPFFLSLRY